MIQPSGFFNQKAKRLRILAAYIHENYEDDLNKFFTRDLQKIRNELLSLNGIGPETEDSILLYAFKIQQVSKERIRAEIAKIIIDKNRSLGIKYLLNLNLLKYILPEVVNMQGVEQPKQYHPEMSRNN